MYDVNGKKTSLEYLWLNNAWVKNNKYEYTRASNGNLGIVNFV